MAVPGWVRNLDDYRHWFEQELHNSGGRLRDEPLRISGNVRMGRIEPPLILGDPRRQRLEFPDRCYLKFQVVVNWTHAQIFCASYFYDYAKPNDKRIWGIHKHRDPAGQPSSHIHRDDDPPEPYPEIDVGYVLKCIRTGLV
jgi:hypothetical protein